jgi:diadenosine tetraphosphate (Ap4A) HIT family hydrolase
MSNFIFTTKYWGVDVMDDQTYFGRLVLVVLAPRQTLPELNEEEQRDFFIMIKRLETFFKEEFQATMFNYSCLMNNAYRDGETPHVHFHFRPRYAKPIVVLGQTFSDPNFGEHYISPSLNNHLPPVCVSDEIKQHLITKLQTHFAQ